MPPAGGMPWFFKIWLDWLQATPKGLFKHTHSV
jgi:hypothetical protein